MPQYSWNTAKVAKNKILLNKMYIVKEVFKPKIK
jgi:hypothetical protein